MNRERWENVKSLFLEATTLPTEEQQIFLRDLDSADEEVAALLEQLLAQSTSNGPDLRHACWTAAPETAAPHALEPGRTLLTRFDIVGFLGSGGLGEVYRAYDRQQQVNVALKTLRLVLAYDQSAVASLRNEVNMARLVTHPNVCRIYDFHFDPDDNLPFVTMELLEGETLAQRLHRDGRLSVEAAAPIVDQMLTALEAAHQNGIIHRDFKTANVMLADGLLVKVMDFGLAREVKPGGDLATTLLTNTLAGTPAYMAPEQLRGGPATVASDIHGLGVVLFEVVTGRRPFEGATPLEIASRRLQEEAPSPRQYNIRLDRRWEYTILRCLAREPSRRPASVSAVRECLHRRPPMLVLSRRAWIAGGATATLFGIFGTVTYVLTRNLRVVVEVFDIENRSQDAGLDYLCRGTTSEVMRRLAQMTNVVVIPARTSRSQADHHARAAFALGGSVQTDRGQLRLRVQLEDTATGTPVWIGDFDRKRFDNLLELQAEIVGGATAKLKQYLARTTARPRLAAFAFAGADGAAAGPTNSTIAFDSYLRGNSLLQEASQESVRAAVDYFQRAVREDPRFALAYAALAEAHLSLRNFGHLPDPDLAAAARRYAETSVEIEPGLAEGYAALGAVGQLEWDWPRSEQSYDTALRLKPNFPRARRWRAGLVLQFGRFQEAIAEVQRAFEEDPYDRSAVALHGLTFLFADRCREAADVLEKGIGDRDLPVARYNLCQAYARLGQRSNGADAAEYYRKALAEAEKVATIEQRNPQNSSELSVYMLSLIYSIRKEFAEARPYLQRLAKAVADQRSSPIHLAMAYASQENLPAALQLVEQAFALRDRFVLYLRVNIFLENLRGQPRFEAVLRALHLK
jgi:serine/threonine-protein kinase